MRWIIGAPRTVRRSNMSIRSHHLDLSVIVLGTDQLVSNFARPDLKIDEYRKLDLPENVQQAYVILTSRHNKDQDLYPSAPQVYAVERAGVVLAVVKWVQ